MSALESNRKYNYMYIKLNVLLAKISNLYPNLDVV